jgi:CRP/FNR family cyclic AMP-dependent transcriptional regulator
MPAADAHVGLLRADPGFAAGIPAEDRGLADRILTLPRLDLDPGPWAVPPGDRWVAPVAGMLLADGVIVRHVALGDRVASQLLGPGDVFDPWPAGDDLLPCAVHWSAATAATAVVLDGRLSTAARRWPSLATTVQRRLARLGERLAVHLAICQLPRVEQRVLALLWHLAERFGRVTPDGVLVPLRLTHRLIGELVGAQRPTVTLALANLIADGVVTRRGDGSHVLDRSSRAELDPTARPAPVIAAPAAEAPAAPADILRRVRLLRSELEARGYPTSFSIGTSTRLPHSVHEPS